VDLSFKDIILISIMATKNKIIKEWGAWGAGNKKSAANLRAHGIKARAVRSDAGKKRKP
jgi:hypothetical protein